MILGGAAAFDRIAEATVAQGEDVSTLIRTGRRGETGRVGIGGVATGRVGSAARTTSGIASTIGTFTWDFAAGFVGGVLGTGARNDSWGSTIGEGLGSVGLGDRLAGVRDLAVGGYAIYRNPRDPSAYVTFVGGALGAIGGPGATRLRDVGTAAYGVYENPTHWQSWGQLAWSAAEATGTTGRVLGMAVHAGSKALPAGAAQAAMVFARTSQKGALKEVAQSEREIEERVRRNFRGHDLSDPTTRAMLDAQKNDVLRRKADIDGRYGHTEYLGSGTYVDAFKTQGNKVVTRVREDAGQVGETWNTAEREQMAAQMRADHDQLRRTNGLLEGTVLRKEPGKALGENVADFVPGVPNAQVLSAEAREIGARQEQLIVSEGRKAARNSPRPMDIDDLEKNNILHDPVTGVVVPNGWIDATNPTLPDRWRAHP